MMYSLLKNLLFTLEPERAHALTLSSLNRLNHLGLLSLVATKPVESDAVQLMGLTFPNRIGIAAGLDKNAVCMDALGALGVGFVEVGTVTPRAQVGNPKPRIFRLTDSDALINRMGFPNDGMEVVAQRLRQSTFKGIRGVNIGKNAATSLADATQDYLTCLRHLAPQADYIAINVSSPNTVGLRSLQAAEHLRPMLVSLLEARAQLLPTLQRSLPMVVKLAPDLNDDELQSIAELLLELSIDGVIATNTTLSRPANIGPLGAEAGGLSGRPVQSLSLATVSKLRRLLGPAFPIIGVGGIGSGEDALSMRRAGADLVQVYTGLIYQGPGLIADIARAMRGLR
jgi:dihydroorotate dehydrogenase